MSHESNKALLNMRPTLFRMIIPFQSIELDRIIAGEVVSPHQAAIMARELKNDVRPKLLRQLRMITANMLWYAEESVCHPDPNYQCSLAVWLRWCYCRYPRTPAASRVCEK